MNTPASLIDQLQTEEDIETAVKVYKSAHQAVKAYEAVKEQARGFVGAYLTETKQTRGKTVTGTFGLTQPTPTYRLNEEKWEAACARNARLAALEQQFRAAQRALDEAQRDFLEEVTPEPVVYIR